MSSSARVTWALALSTLIQLELGYAAANLPIPWSTTYYGPDGPWQAITVKVGGLDSQGTTQVDVYPSGKYRSMILSKAACADYPSTPCGKGGFWEPAYKNETDTNLRTAWGTRVAGLSGSGEEYLQAMTVNGQTISNVPLASIDNAVMMSPGGTTYGPELGWVALGGGFNSGDQVQIFDNATSDNTSTGFMITAGLFNQSIIPSYSYGLHFGSARLNYGGSLVLGGYDKGRIMGEYTNYTGDTLTLLDIGFGVEKGGSPFSGGFTSKSGLLLSNFSEPNPLSVSPDTSLPSLYLPGKTCENIAKYLPVSFDTTLQYYLWDTEDPSYEKIVTSPAYLSFTFPPSTGQGANITIKVPFMLLNLTLDTPLVSTPTPYFPCTDFTPYTGDYYRLGRAFLQAAFTGHNYRTATSWLGQAPGPGVSKNGLGEDLHDIQDADTEIETSTDNGTTFADSWDGYWTPLAKDGTETASPSAAAGANLASSSSRLSTGAKAGAVVGAVVLCMLVSGAAFLCWRRRRQRPTAESSQAHMSDNQRLDMEGPVDGPGAARGQQYPYCAADVGASAEQEKSPFMLDGTEVIHQLPENWLRSPRELEGGLRISFVGSSLKE